jgi:phospholipid N-methyltransferase
VATIHASEAKENPVPAKSRPRHTPLLLFGRNFFKHPRMLGSVIPSSRFLINQVLEPVDWDKARVLVEFGPGVGTITNQILKRMNPSARLIAIEMNQDFVKYLRESIHDPRFEVVNGSAADIGTVLAERGLASADYVFSGIPFSTMPEEVRASIVQSTADAVSKDGAFVVYQFSPKVRSYLERAFGSVETSFEPLNVPPAQIFVCRPQRNGRHR